MPLVPLPPTVKVYKQEVVYKCLSQSCAVANIIFYLVVYKRLAAQQMFPQFGFRIRTTAPWLMEQSSILSIKFHCPVDHQSVSASETAHVCENTNKRVSQSCAERSSAAPKRGLASM